MNILLDLFLTFAKIGVFTFGGGYAMISMIENNCVERKKWIYDHRRYQKTGEQAHKSYTKMSGIVVAAPKTPCSVRTIPLIEGVKIQLLQLHQEAQIRHPNTFLLTAFVFEGKPISC